MTPTIQVLAHATLSAVRRRDHVHARDAHCQPHAVEEIDLGRETTAVCHDCAWTSPWGPRTVARYAANQHLLATA